MSRKSRKNGTKILQDKKPLEVASYLTAAYIRLSKEDIELDQNSKLDNQEEVIRDFVKDKPEFKMIKTYRDNGCTGTNFKRDAFQAMMNDIKNHRIECIIVKDLSRLGRNHIEAEEYISVIFPFMKVRFIAINDHYDSDKADADLTVSLKNIINDAYAKDISRKIFSTKLAQRQRGEFVGNIPPFGYDKSMDDPHKLVVNNETAPTVQYIFELKEQGFTNTEIAKRLDAEGFITPTQYWYQRGKLHQLKYAVSRWAASTVNVLLSNQMYVGDMVQGKKTKCLAAGKTKVEKQPEDCYVVVADTHEALIERERFETVQRIREAEKTKNREKRKRYKDIQSSEELFKGLIFHKDGQKMYRSRHVYGDKKVCYGYVTSNPFYYISEADVINAVKEALYSYIKLLYSMDGFKENSELQKAYSRKRKTELRQVEQLKKQIHTYKHKLASLYKEMVEGTLSVSEYQNLKQEYLRQKQDTEAVLHDYESERVLQEPDWNAIHSCEYKQFIASRQLTKSLVQSCVKIIRVADKKKVEIEFLFMDEIERFIQHMRA